MSGKLSAFTCGNMWYRTVKSKAGLPVSVVLVCRRRVWSDHVTENDPLLIDLEDIWQPCEACPYYCEPDKWRSTEDGY